MAGIEVAIGKGMPITAREVLARRGDLKIVPTVFGPQDSWLLYKMERERVFGKNYIEKIGIMEVTIENCEISYREIKGKELKELLERNKKP